MSVIERQPLVSVGLPVYNRPRLLYEALGHIVGQRYKNLEIIISDDCSPNQEIQKIIREFMSQDSRIKYYRQEKNIGGIENHRFVFENSNGEYYFWASEDDKLNEKFVQTGIEILINNPNYDAWCCTLNNIDTFGRVIREYPGFSRFTSSGNKRKDLIRYLLEPEILGKSNIFHGIFRKDALTQTAKQYFINDAWGSDICFNLAFLTRYNLIATDEVLFYKRVIRETDNEHHADPIVIKKSNKRSFPFNRSSEYIREHYKATKGTQYKNIVILIMIYRMMISFRNKCLGRLESVIRGIRNCGCYMYKLVR